MYKSSGLVLRGAIVAFLFAVVTGLIISQCSSGTVTAIETYQRVTVPVYAVHERCGRYGDRDCLTGTFQIHTMMDTQHFEVEVDEASATYIRHWSCVRVTIQRNRGGLGLRFRGLAPESFCR